MPLSDLSLPTDVQVSVNKRKIKIRRQVKRLERGLCRTESFFAIAGLVWFDEIVVGISTITVLVPSICVVSNVPDRFLAGHFVPIADTGAWFCSNLV